MRRLDLSDAGAMRPDAEAARTAGDDDAGRFRAALSGDGGRALRGGLTRVDRLVPAAGRGEQGAGPLSLRGQHPSGAGPADGGPVGAHGGEPPDGGLGFDAPVGHDGYAWWYVDALSGDGRCGLTIIGFVGSVFSPYYAWTRRRGRGDPEDHCAINVALYGPGRNRWAMTERGRGALARDGRSLSVGPSSMDWDGTVLTIRIDERTVPWPGRIRGTVRVRPEAVLRQRFALDAAGRHGWRPFAPCARAEVALESPSLHWSGAAYVDMNAGDEPLEAAFRDWDWSRATTPEGGAILYDVRRRDGTDLCLALSTDRTGDLRALEPPPLAPLPRTRWGVARRTPRRRRQ